MHSSMQHPVQIGSSVIVCVMQSAGTGQSSSMISLQTLQSSVSTTCMERPRLGHVDHVKLEGLYNELSSSLSFSSSKHTILRRKDLFNKINNVKDEFTAYEYFLYNDNQNYSTASAPGLGSNLAGVNFINKVVKPGTIILQKLITQKGLILYIINHQVLQLIYICLQTFIM